jgi:hypothetical protein
VRIFSGGHFVSYIYFAIRETQASVVRLLAIGKARRGFLEDQGLKTSD